MLTAETLDMLAVVEAQEDLPPRILVEYNEVIRGACSPLEHVQEEDHVVSTQTVSSTPPS